MTNRQNFGHILAAESPQIQDEMHILNRIIRLEKSQTAYKEQRKSPDLFHRFKVDGFPLRTRSNRMLPPWRTLSPWMRLQIATLALNDSLFINFSATLHDDVTAQQIKSGQDMKVYLRDRLSRLLRQHFGAERPGFFFVLEANDKIGQSTRPHVHGSIRLPSIDASGMLINIRPKKKFKFLPDEKSANKRGKDLLHQIIKTATGNGPKSPMVSKIGLSQKRNVATEFPRFVLQNSDWTTYTMKNATRFHPDLPENRVAMSHNLNREARLLWDIIRRGDKRTDCSLSA